MPRMPEKATPDVLPELRVQVAPYDGWRNKWQWRLEERDLMYQNTQVWETVQTSGWHDMRGYAKTEEQALEKAREAADNYRKKIMEKEAKKKSIEDATYFVPLVPPKKEEYEESTT
jgi:hypothetical protein